MLSRMSWKRWTGSLEGNDPVLFNFASQPIFLNGLSNNVDRPLEYFRQSLAQSVEAPEIRESLLPGFVDQPDNDVDVRILALLAARSRAEQRQPGDAGGPQLGLVGPQLCYDVVAIHLPTIRLAARFCHEVRA